MAAGPRQHSGCRPRAGRRHALVAGAPAGYPRLAWSPDIAPLLPASLLLLAQLTGCDDGARLDPLDRDHDGWIEPFDCDDLDPTVNPDAVEICDGRDNDCEGTADGVDAIDAQTWHRDADGDGAGSDAILVSSCAQVDGYIELGGDCDDSNASIGPDADELCNGVDDDCDDLVDESDAVDATTWYLDQDGDDYGTAGVTTRACSQPAGYAEPDTDCDDSDPAVNPAAAELCDPADTDEDCNGLADDEDPDAEGLLSWYLDGDGDGYGLDDDVVDSCEPVDGRAELPGDCDDSDDGVHPDSAELCGNGLDDDCDGQTDGDDPDATGDVAFFADADLDGYGDPDAPLGSGCDLVDGLSALSTDCDDTDADVYPGATETWYDGVDQDCDGNDSDADEDGYAADAEGGLDCDDGDADVSPGAVELCGNGVDDDCDGSVDPCAIGAWLQGLSADDRAGISVAGLGDVDGDGLGDLLVGGDHAGDGGTGAAWLVLGPVSGETLLDTAYALEGSESAGHVGAAVAGPGDLDGDGLAELLIGGPDVDAGGGDGSGAVWILGGPITGGGLVEDLASAVLLGEDGDDGAGGAVSGAGDVDGDGWQDLVVGADHADPSGSRTGSVYVVRGPVSGSLDLWLADGRWSGEEAGDEAGGAVASAGDVDGDGLDDVLVGAPQQLGDGDSPGAAYLLAGPATGALDLDSATARLLGSAAGDRAGEAVSGAGDVDGDGHDDLLIGAPERDLGGSGSGAAYLVLGPVSGGLELDDADLVIEGATPEDRAGSAVLGGVDLDGDGGPDLVIGAEDDDVAFSDGGAVYVLLGPGLGVIELDGDGGSGADLRLDATAAGLGLGAALAPVPDLDGLGVGLVVGVPHAAGGADDSGAAWVVPGW